MKSVCIINVFAKRDTIGMLQESVVEFLDWTIYEDWFPCFFLFKWNSMKILKFMMDVMKVIGADLPMEKSNVRMIVNVFDVP